MSKAGGLIYWAVTTFLTFGLLTTIAGAFFLKGAWVGSGDAFNAAPIWLRWVTFIASGVIGAYAVAHERR